MTKNKPILLLTIAAILGLLATTAAGRYLESQAGSSSSGAKIIVAAIDLLPGTCITEESMAEMLWPAERTPASLVTQPDQALGMYVAVDIAAGEPLVKNRLADTSLSGTLTGYIPDGYRAMAIKIDRSVKAGGLLEPGCHVDVLTVMTQRSRTPVSKIILQNIKVLSVGVRKTDMADETSAAKTSGTEEVVTLLLRPGEAEKLAFAMTRGKIQVMARGSSDKTEIETAGFSSEGFLDDEQPAPEPVVAEAEVEPAKVDRTAEVLFAKARSLEGSGDLEKARAIYNRISDEYTDDEFALKAVERLSDVSARLDEKLKLEACEKGLAVAREMLEKGLFDECRSKAAEIIGKCGSMEYRGEPVADILAKIRLKADDSEKRARVDFQLFTNWINNGNLAQARLYLNKLAKEYPESTFHRKAAEMIQKAETTSCSQSSPSADKPVEPESNHETQK